MPGLRVADVGVVALPLQQEQALRLRDASTQAPFGRGADTVVDTSVRRCRQIEANKVELSPAWVAVSCLTWSMAHASTSLLPPVRFSPLPPPPLSSSAPWPRPCL